MIPIRCAAMIVLSSLLAARELRPFGPGEAQRKLSGSRAVRTKWDRVGSKRAGMPGSRSRSGAGARRMGRDTSKAALSTDNRPEGQDAERDGLATTLSN